MKRIVLMFGAVMAALLVLPATAHAADPIAAAVDGLKGHTVYVAPDSGQDVSQPEIQALEAQIAAGRAPIVIAVLPESASSAAGGVDALPHTLAIALGDPTIVVGVVSGHSFRAGAKAGAGLDKGEAGQFAGDAIKAHSPASNRLAVALGDFVTRVDNRVTQRASGGSTATTSSGSSKGGSDTGKILLWVAGGLVLLALIGFGAWYFLRDRNEEEDEDDRYPPFSDRAYQQATTNSTSATATREQPTKTVTINHNYGGNGYGYYPTLGGWGYYNANNMFVLGMLHEDAMRDNEERYEHHEATASSSSGSSSSGSGDWGSSSPSHTETPSYSPPPSYDPPSFGGGDWGGSSGGGGGGGGGGGDW